MNKNAFLTAILGAALLMSVAACKDDTSTKASSGSTENAPSETASATQPAEAPAPKIEKAAPHRASANALQIFISHAEPKPNDPVVVTFEDIQIATASFDAEDLTGARAELLVNMAALSSGIPKRDGHLSSPDYLDTKAFPKTSIKVHDVKKSDGDAYQANATVTTHGVEKTWPVTFDVVARDADGSITIEAEHEFSRLDFGIGKAEGDSVASNAKAKLRVTFPASS